MLGQKPGSGTLKPIPLVDHGYVTTNPLALEAVSQALGRWMAVHIGGREQRKLIRWILQKGGHLHQQFAKAIEHEMRQRDDILESVRKIWRVLTGNHVCDPNDDWSFDLHERISQGEWSPALRLDLLKAFSPCLDLRPQTGLFGTPYEESDGQREITVRSLAWADCKTCAGQGLSMLVRDLRSRPDWADILKELSLDLVGLLKQALVLQSAVDDAGTDFDHSFIHWPSVATPAQNPEWRDDWTTLIDLVRQSFDVLIDQEPSRARLMVEICVAIPFPTFRLLSMYALSKLISTDVPDVDNTDDEL